MTARALMRLTASLHNTPHLATQETLMAVLSILDTRNSGQVDAKLWGNLDSKRIDPETNTKTWESGIGVLQVDGALSYRPVYGWCGEVGTSYETLVSSFEEMANAGVKTVVFEHSSGGGEATHVFEAARRIRAIADANNIQLIGYADTMAASASYALLCICDVVVANPSALVGSIGCVVALLDTSKYEANLGVKRLYISSAASKVPFDADGSFKTSFLEEMQERVSDLGEEFCQFVADHTGLSVEAVRETDAKCFPAKQALERGLVNSVMERMEFADFVTKAHKKRMNSA